MHALNSPASSITSIRNVAAFAVLEARRTRLPLVVIGIGVLALAASVFVRSLTITESARIQAGFLAAMLRMTAVFLLCLHVPGSMLREAHDKGTDLLLSVDISRFEYLAGKALGYGIVATGVALALAAPLLVVAPPLPALAWAASLVLETWIIVAASLFCVITFNQLILAASMVFAFYLLARAMAAIVLIAGADLLQDGSLAHAVMTGVVKVVALALPPLDAFTQTAWLVDGVAAWNRLPLLAAQTGLYLILLLAAAGVDLYRRNG